MLMKKVGVLSLLFWLVGGCKFTSVHNSWSACDGRTKRMLHGLDSEKGAPTDNKEDDQDMTASRFVCRFLNYLFRGFLAKEKIVRFRVLQIVSETISHLGLIEYVPLVFLCRVFDVDGIVLIVKRCTLRYMTAL
jgi:hypothetical protein